MIAVLCFIAMTGSVLAECSLDHFIIGINEDSVWGTDDDNKLFLDCWQKYRRAGDDLYEHWYYPMTKSFFGDYRIGEPGFDQFQDTDSAASYTYDPNRCPVGTPDQDYSITIECASLSDSLTAVHSDYPIFTIDAAGQSFSHSYIADLRGSTHMHMSYRCEDPNLAAVSWQLYDDTGKYEPSNVYTIVFNAEPLPGDLVVDRTVNSLDLVELGYYWLYDDGSIDNDYYERADANRDGTVNMLDFALMAANWLDSL